MNLDWSVIVSALIGLFGGGSIAMLIRAPAQNRVDERTQLTTEQQAFRQAMAEQLAALRTQLNEVEKRNDALEAETREQGKQLAALQTRNEYQERQLADQGKLIADLRTQNATQAQQLASLTEEKSALAQKVQIAEAKASFLERENNDLRQEVHRLQGRLPARVEQLS